VNAAISDPSSGPRPTPRKTYENASWQVAAAAVGRAVLIGRAAATMTAAAGGLLLVNDRWQVIGVLALVAAATGAEIGVLTRWPQVVATPVAAIAVDSMLVLAVLAVSRGSISYFCYATGAGALAGVLLGMRALPLWTAQAAVNFAVAAAVLHASVPPAEIAAFVVAFPMAGVLAGIGTAVATTTLMRYIEFSAQLVASAQRCAAASERARLARELHDSVTKTLRGVSFAALALPSSLRRHPALAEQLAGTVSAGAAAAARQARELLEGLRLDAPDRDFTESITGLCQTWSASTRIPVRTTLAALDPPVAVRYELTRILREALSNVAHHSCAERVLVRLAPTEHGMILKISDDGVGFAVPTDLSSLHSTGHFGIVGMIERARTVGGELHIESAPGAGTSIAVRIPLNRYDKPSDRIETHIPFVGTL
jgi:signal transduction histidine kinase